MLVILFSVGGCLNMQEKGTFVKNLCYTNYKQ